MNKERLLKEMGEISPEFINEARPRESAGGGTRRPRYRWLAAAAALLVVLGAVAALAIFLPKGNDPRVDAYTGGTELPTGQPTAGGQDVKHPPEASSAPTPESTEPGSPATGGKREDYADANGMIAPVYGIASPDEMEYPANPEPYRNTSDRETYDKLVADWMAATAERRSASRTVPDMNSFVRSLTNELIRENEGENLVFSPASIYIALSMLAEVSDGNTRAEVLSVLGVSDMQALRSGAAALLAAECYDDEVSASVIADSFWLNGSIRYETETLERLAELYDAASFGGDPAAEEYAAALREWINEATRGLLNDSVDGIRLDPNTALALVSAIYFKDAWEEEFHESNTSEGVFHAETGDIVCDFMNKNYTGVYYRGTNYSAVYDALSGDSAGVVYLLPDEGVSIEEMLSSDALSRFGCGERFAEGLTYGDIDWMIDITVPKLDVSSDLDLIPTLKALGMNDCFDDNRADFTPLTTDVSGLFVSQVKHAARVKTDESGVEAAAYTLITLGYNGVHIPNEEKRVEIILDRPFVFVIIGESGAPLFIGAVNTPNE